MTIKISRNVENRITVSCPYNPDYIAKIKTIQGYRWHPEEKYWSGEPCSDISPNWEDIRTKFGYTMLYAINSLYFGGNYNSDIHVTVKVYYIK